MTHSPFRSYEEARSWLKFIGGEGEPRPNYSAGLSAVTVSVVGSRLTRTGIFPARVGLWEEAHISTRRVG